MRLLKSKIWGVSLRLPAFYYKPLDFFESMGYNISVYKNYILSGG